MRRIDLGRAVADLKTCAKLLGVRVVRQKPEDELLDNVLAAWTPIGNRIIVGDWAWNRPTTKLAYILAHELGHVLDARSMTKKELVGCIELFQLFNHCVRVGVRPPSELRSFILQKERRGFEIGESILRSLGIELQRELTEKYKRKSLDGYRDMMR
jgi:hypothetical protein